MATSSLSFSSTRHEALEQWERFLPHVADYSACRNAVVPGHGYVSRLSPAIRCRLITEEEILASLRHRFPFHRVEKFVQEVLWRGYWKAWLERNPGIWQGYQTHIASNFPYLTPLQRERVEEVMCGHSGVAVMDRFAHELVQTGYLHNHARMWWASFWIHVEQLPWQLGADFFYRHLLDGDPASNTLSWRWVAGLQTRGKTYVVRRSNIEKYLAPDLLDPTGLDRLDDERVAPVLLDVEDTANLAPIIGQKTSRLNSQELHSLRWGLWLHEEDLHPESAPFPSSPPAAVFAAFDPQRMAPGTLSAHRYDYIQKSLDDGLQRAKSFWGLHSDQIEFCTQAFQSEGLASWIQRHQLDAVCYLKTFTGSLSEHIPSIENTVVGSGARFISIERPFDLKLKALGSGGFFPFWAQAKQSIGW
jgi:deoxyribodipyrimidine photo-lyase